MSSIQRHAVVLGATGGIGRALAQRFAEGGHHLHLLGRDPARLGQLRDAITASTGRPAEVVECHVDDPASIASALASPPRIDVLINAAGSVPRRSLLESTTQEWRGPWVDKVLGSIEACRLACERMRETGGGVIINIIGTAGVRPNPRTILTVTSNASLIAFTHALGGQSIDWGVRVVGINPGLTDTPRTKDLAAGRGADAYQALLRDLPLQRMGRAEEIADCAWFLASDQAAYISGTVIDVDGGARWRI